MRKWRRIVINVILSLIVAAGVGAAAVQQLRWRDSADAREKAAITARFTPPEFPLPAPEEPEEPPAPPEPPDPVAQSLAELDLAALRAVNPDVVGWIYLPGTDISYPLLQGADNDYYLKHTWERKWNGGGSIFLDWRASPELDGFHTVVYGHRMNNSSMFAPLHSFQDQDFLLEHPSVYVAVPGRVGRYDIFAAWEPGVSSLVYADNLTSEEDRQALLDLCLSSSLVDAGLTPGPGDRLLTLSTCTGRGHATRWVVQAVLAETFEYA